MININSAIKADRVIDSDLISRDLISGNVSVLNSAVFINHGMIIGNVDIAAGATLILHGTLDGTITNRGYCEIYGTIHGSFKDFSHNSMIDPNAQINTTS